MRSAPFSGCLSREQRGAAGRPEKEEYADCSILLLRADLQAKI